MEYTEKTWMNKELFEHFGFKQYQDPYYRFQRGDVNIIKPYFDNYHILCKGVKLGEEQLYSNTERFYSVSDLEYLLAEFYGEELENGHKTGN